MSIEIEIIICGIEYVFLNDKMFYGFIKWFLKKIKVIYYI